MTTNLSLTFGITCILLGCYLFFIYYQSNKQLKFKKKSKKLSFLMRVISIVLIAIGGYHLLNLDLDIYPKKTAKSQTEWSQTAKDSLRAYCIFEMGKMSEEYQKINLDYCTCKSNKIMDTYTQTEYEEILKKRPNGFFEIFHELPKDCLPELERRYDSIDKVKKLNIIKKN